MSAKLKKGKLFKGNFKKSVTQPKKRRSIRLATEPVAIKERAASVAGVRKAFFRNNRKKRKKFKIAQISQKNMFGNFIPQAMPKLQT